LSLKFKTSSLILELKIMNPAFNRTKWKQSKSSFKMNSAGNSSNLRVKCSSFLRVMQNKIKNPSQKFPKNTSNRSHNGTHKWAEISIYYSMLSASLQQEATLVSLLNFTGTIKEKP
jgi:hypothetical protein